jgi:hypothetical protein
VFSDTVLNGVYPVLLGVYSVLRGVYSVLLFLLCFYKLSLYLDETSSYLYCALCCSRMYVLFCKMYVLLLVDVCLFVLTATGHKPNCS